MNLMCHYNFLYIRSRMTLIGTLIHESMILQTNPLSLSLSLSLLLARSLARSLARLLHMVRTVGVFPIPQVSVFSAGWHGLISFLPLLLHGPFCKYMHSTTPCELSCLKQKNVEA